MAAITKYIAEQKIWSGPEYVCKNPTVPFGKSLIDKLEMHGDKIMQINDTSGYKMTAREMRLKALKVAEKLTELGIKPGDVIQLCLNEHDDMVPLWLGIVTSGAVLNTLHTEFFAHEMSYFIGLVEPKMIICEERIIETIRKGLVGAGHEAPVWTFSKSKDVEVNSVDELIAGYDQEFTYTPPELGDLSEALAFILCTSGTTAMPKTVLISHEMAKYGLFKEWPAEDGLVLFSGNQLYWISCLSTIIMAISLRMVRIITEDPITPERVLDLVVKNKCNVLYMGANFLRPAIEILKKRSYDLSALKMMQTSGSILTQKTREEFKEHCKTTLLMYIYGISDTASGIAISYGMSKVYSTGQLMPGVQVKIVDENGESLSQLETGEIYVKIPPKILGYAKIDRKKDGVFSDDDWFITGDLGFFDLDNELFVVDRKKDVIRYKGCQVSPSDIEQLVEKHIDIQSIVVIGLPDPLADGMEIPAALVIKSKHNPNVTEEEICKIVEDNMMDTKRLRGGVFFVQSIPETKTGKFQRNKALAIAIDLSNKKLETVDKHIH